MDNILQPFEVGDEVVCVDDSNCMVMGLRKGNKYMVLAVVKEICGSGWHIGFRIGTDRLTVMPCACGCHSMPSHGFVYAYDHRFRRISPYQNSVSRSLAEQALKDTGDSRQDIKPERKEVEAQ